MSREIFLQFCEIFAKLFIYIAFRHNGPSRLSPCQTTPFTSTAKHSEIINFVFREIFLQFCEIFAKHEIEICKKCSLNSKEISWNTKLIISRNFRENTNTKIFAATLPRTGFALFRSCDKMLWFSKISSFRRNLFSVYWFPDLAPPWMPMEKTAKGIVSRDWGEQ